MLDSSLSYIKITDEYSYSEMFISKRYETKAKKRNVNKKYIYLPIIGAKGVMFIKWKSLNPKLMSSSGKVKQKSTEPMPFKVTFYYNLFNKKSFDLNIDYFKSLLNKDIQ